MASFFDSPKVGVRSIWPGLSSPLVLYICQDSDQGKTLWPMIANNPHLRTAQYPHLATHAVLSGEPDLAKSNLLVRAYLEKFQFETKRVTMEWLFACIMQKTTAPVEGYELESGSWEIKKTEKGKQRAEREALKSVQQHGELEEERLRLLADSNTTVDQPMNGVESSGGRSADRSVLRPGSRLGEPLPGCKAGTLHCFDCGRFEPAPGETVLKFDEYVKDAEGKERRLCIPCRDSFLLKQT